MRTGDVGSDRDDAPEIRQRVGSESPYAQTLLHFFLEDQARPAILGIERCIDLQTIEIVVFEIDVQRAPCTREVLDVRSIRIF